MRSHRLHSHQDMGVVLRQRVNACAAALAARLTRVSLLSAIVQLAASSALAQITNFVIDPTQSYVSLSGNVQYNGTYPYSGQFPGGLTTKLSGSVFADTSDPSRLWLFSSMIDLATQSFPALPGPVPAQLAAQVVDFPSNGIVSNVAFQNIVLGTATTIADVSGGMFPADRIFFDTAPGAIANIHAPGLYSGTSAVEASGWNTFTSGTWQTVGGTEQLVIPFSFTGTTIGTELLFEGVIVANASGQVSDAPGAPVQWSTAEGGNGHYYVVVNHGDTISWEDAEALAASLTFNGQSGHLATITSSQENAFLFDTFGNSVRTKWLGGFQPAGSQEPDGGWQWITGEPFNYTNWGGGEPNNSGGQENHLLAYTDGFWNDLDGVNPPDGWATGYVVEFVPEPSSWVLMAVVVPVFVLRVATRRSARRRFANARRGLN